ncbi:12154_t:CDS:2 [Cetraspora pellucida]|uniref:12154_t:CDS:1 n=1 Tax=Cetraspora pellucida TaxID=1433469 RepID=A0A9N9BR39_9GLOM|nr:12154_t:CDS:2 [Cetraspora pellucida]
MAQEKRNSNILPLKKCSKTRTLRSLSTSMIPQTKSTSQLSDNKIVDKTQITRNFSLSSHKLPKPTMSTISKLSTNDKSSNVNENNSSFITKNKLSPIKIKKKQIPHEVKKTIPTLEIKKNPSPLLEVKKKPSSLLEVKKKPSSLLEIKKKPSSLLEIKKKPSSLLEIKKNPSSLLEIKKNPSSLLEVKKKPSSLLEVKKKPPLEIKKKLSLFEIKKKPSQIEIKKNSSPLEVKKKSLEILKNSSEPLVIKKKSTPFLTKNKSIPSIVKKKSIPLINESSSFKTQNDIETKRLTPARGRSRGRSREQKDIKYGNNGRYEWKDNEKIGDEKEYSEKRHDDEKDVDGDINDKEFLDTLLSKVDLSHPITIKMITQVIELQMKNSLLRKGNQVLWQEYKWQSNLERELIEELNKMETAFEKVTSPENQTDNTLNSLKIDLSDSSPSMIVQKDKQQELEEDLAFLRVTSIIESMKNDILTQLEYGIDKINVEE